ncbi:hypothetical protein [Listeria welshimeri]|uniref:hypothetical protein n=1 Tax=Listeria welshimeri TaxID=1643 RepID=UPI0016296B71|nr:hypothetical protein [Listeria welshimeri]MBC1342349.1 hypothetical protein [Listeria welshimeri]MBF2342594.1 hypothetical protein [Listeria welshimeri]
MYKTNLAKFEDIEQMMNEVIEAKNVYLEALEKRNKYTKEMRSKYMLLSNRYTSVFKLLTELKNKKELKEKEDKILEKELDKVLYNLNERLAENFNLEIKKDIIFIKKIREEKLNIDTILSVKPIISKYNLNKAVFDRYLKDYSSSYDEDLISILNLWCTEAKKTIDIGFRNFKDNFHDKTELNLITKEIINITEPVKDKEIRKVYKLINPILINAKIEETRRPDNKYLLSKIQPIRSSGNMFFKAKNTSKSQILCENFALSVAKVRRVLLEENEYKSVNNAFNKLDESFQEFLNYMNERYYQRGGTPENYHGHDSR